MKSRFLLIFSVIVLTVMASGAMVVRGGFQLPDTYVPPGKQLYRNYCASCHGLNGKGSGPVSRSLRKPPPDLTSLAKRHGGKFPDDYVTEVLRFGLTYSAHGSSDMPIWGPIFQDEEHYNEAAVRQRIKNLCDYVASLQE